MDEVMDSQPQSFITDSSALAIVKWPAELPRRWSIYIEEIDTFSRHEKDETDCPIQIYF